MMRALGAALAWVMLLFSFAHALAGGLAGGARQEAAAPPGPDPLRVAAACGLAEGFARAWLGGGSPDLSAFAAPGSVGPVAPGLPEGEAVQRAFVAGVRPFGGGALLAVDVAAFTGKRWLLLSVPVGFSGDGRPAVWAPPALRPLPGAPPPSGPDLGKPAADVPGDLKGFLTGFFRAYFAASSPEELASFAAPDRRIEPLGGFADLAGLEVASVWGADPSWWAAVRVRARDRASGVEWPQAYLVRLSRPGGKWAVEEIWP